MTLVLISIMLTSQGKLLLKVSDIKMTGASIAENSIIYKEILTKSLKASYLKMLNALTVRKMVLAARKVNKLFLKAMGFQNEC